MTRSPVVRAADRLDLMAAIAKPKPVKVARKKRKRSKSERRQLEAKLWKATADYVKCRDKICVTCGSGERLTLSHYIKCGKQRIRYDLRNCNVQCASCNNYHNYYPHIYEGYMRRTYGNAVLDELEQLASLNGFKWSVIELRAMLEDMENKLISLRDDCGISVAIAQTLDR